MGKSDKVDWTSSHCLVCLDSGEILSISSAKITCSCEIPLFLFQEAKVFFFFFLHNTHPNLYQFLLLFYYSILNSLNIASLGDLGASCSECCVICCWPECTILPIVNWWGRTFNTNSTSLYMTFDYIWNYRLIVL